MQKWKSIYLVLRPNTLSIYKNEKESKLRYQIHLTDLSAVTYLKDPKHKRQNIFGLFSPSKNFHLQAATEQDTQEWVELIRKEARLEEEDEELFLSGPMARSLSPGGFMAVAPDRAGYNFVDRDRVLSSSPETFGPPAPGFLGREPSYMDSSGQSGNELPSHSDMSDTDQRIRGASIESLTTPGAFEVGSLPGGGIPYHPGMGGHATSQTNVANAQEQDPDRVMWQGWLWYMRSKGGVKQWKNMWGVLRPRNLILYKDESEYLAQWIVQLPAVVDVVDMDPVSKSKENCLQIITEEKSYKFCARDEESLVQFVGAFKSLLAKRRMNSLT